MQLGKVVHVHLAARLHLVAPKDEPSGGALHGVRRGRPSQDALALHTVVDDLVLSCEVICGAATALEALVAHAAVP